MKNMKVSMKLVVAFMTITVLAAAVGVAGIVGLNTMSLEAEHMYSLMAVPLSELAEAIEFNQRIRVQITTIALESGDQEALNAVEAELIDRMKNFELYTANYLPSLATQDAKNLFTSMMKQYNEIIKPESTTMLEQARKGVGQVILHDKMSRITQASNTIGDNLDELMSLRLSVMSAANDSTTALFDGLLIVIIAAIVLALGCALFMTFYISSLISKPLAPLCAFMSKAGKTGDITMSHEDHRVMAQFGMAKDEIGQTIASTTIFVDRITAISKALETIAAGDLTVETEPLSSKDTLGLSLQAMTHNLNDMFGNINSSSVQVSTGAGQIANGAQALAQGATEQAASIQELSSSIADITGRTKANASQATQAAKLAGEIKVSAQKGTEQMGEMMEAVKDINKSSQDISRVIKVIDDIAFQTNILALNAAVEAARAGQHGKGFAVVAEEVRNLAAKSADAAKDTESLIATSMEKAELGVRIAGETSESLSEIVLGINESSEIVSGIADSSEEASRAIMQINSGIDQVAQVIQQNSATAEESAAASEEMSSQSTLLQELISHFKIKGAAPQLGAPKHTPRALPAFRDDDYSSSSFGKY